MIDYYISNSSFNVRNLKTKKYNSIFTFFFSSNKPHFYAKIDSISFSSINLNRFITFESIQFIKSFLVVIDT